jgi:hypothetical protein
MVAAISDNAKIKHFMCETIGQDGHIHNKQIASHRGWLRRELFS